MVSGLFVGSSGGETIYVDVNAAGNDNGSSWTDAYPCLGDAIAIAMSGDQIRVAEGFYKVSKTGRRGDGDPADFFEIMTDIELLGGFPTGGGDGSLAARDFALHPTILSGDRSEDDLDLDNNNITESHTEIQGLNNIIIIKGDGVGASFTLNGFIITAADTQALELTNGCHPQIINCRFLGNKSEGAVLIQDAAATFANCSFSGNEGVDAAAVKLVDASLTTFSDCSFANNTGRGLFISTSSVALTDCTLNNNTSSENGGAITSSDSTCSFDRCEFQTNVSNGSGGALHAQNSAINITGCSFRGNTAEYDAGALNLSGSLPLRLINCLISGNSVQEGAGGVNGPASDLVITNCTFSGNFAQEGTGAIDGSMTLINSLVWENHSNSEPPLSSLHSVEGSSITYSHCLIQHLDLTAIGTNNLDGTDTGNDPLFLVPLNPLTAPDISGAFRLQQNSPVLDSGNDFANTEPFDLSGETRITGTIDLGAYEGGFISFSNLFPNLLPNVDSDLNGRLDIVDYAEGRDLSGTSHILKGLRFSYSPTPTLLHTLRKNLGDVEWSYSGSSNLQSFHLLEEGRDHSTPSVSSLTSELEEVSSSLILSSPLSLEKYYQIRYQSTLGPRAIFVDASATGGANSGTSWPNAFLHLQDALDAALQGDQIWVAAGIYRPDQGGNQTPGDKSASFVLKNGVSLYGGFPAGGGDGTFGARDSDPETGGSILSGDLAGDDIDSDGDEIIANVDDIQPNDNSFHVINGTNANFSSILDGFVITAGAALGDSITIESSFGGGILCAESGKPHVSNCLFIGNTASTGGAAGILRTNPAFVDCEFRANRAGGGGAAFIETASPTFTDCLFSHNSADGSGGAVSDFSSSSAQFVNCTFLSNTADRGGAAWISDNSETMLTECQFQLNSASLSGGALHIKSSSSPIVSSCTFTLCNNRAVYNEEATVTVYGSSFIGNDGGGYAGFMPPFAPGFSSATFINTIFSGNSANHGAAAHGSRSGLNFINCTLSGNKATIEGGAIDSSEDLSIINSVIWGNEANGTTSTPLASISHTGNPASYSHSLVENIDLSSTGTGNLNGTLAGNNPNFTAAVNPALAPTLSGNLLPQTGSPVVNIGDDSANTEALDLLGNLRKVGTIDLGAYERQ